MGSLVKVTLGIGVLIVLFAIVPFTISIPADILAFFTGNSVRDFFSSLYYFLPIDYLFACIVLVYTVKYGGLFIKMITWIYNRIF